MATASGFFQVAFVAASILASSADIAKAVDFGIRGMVTGIEEQAFLQMIDERLKEVDQNQIRQEMQERAKQRAKEPIAVDGLEPAKEGRVFYFDPSYVLEKDIYLPNKDLFYKAGTKVNPIEEMKKLGMSLDRRMIFIDAREDEQIQWLKVQLAMYGSESGKNKQEQKDQEKHPGAQIPEHAPIENRVVLVGGRPFALQEELQKDYQDMVVYFDQGGTLTRKMGIKASPAIVSQEDLLLRIEEYRIQEN